MNAPLRKRKPTTLITYRCSHCGESVTRTELDMPVCSFCDAKEGLVETGREPITPESLARGMERSLGRMMESLQKAWDISAQDPEKDDATETMLLQTLAQGQDLKKDVEKMMKKFLKSPKDSQKGKRVVWDG